MDTPSLPTDYSLFANNTSTQEHLSQQGVRVMSPYHAQLRDLFCTPRQLSFSIGWDVDVLEAIKHAKRAGFTSMIIEYDPPTLSSYTKMLEIVNYDEYLQEHRDLIEDVKYSLLSQTTGDVVIDDASSETELIIDILDILSKFNSTVKINFYLYLPQQAI